MKYQGSYSVKKEDCDRIMAYLDKNRDTSDFFSMNNLKISTLHVQNLGGNTVVVRARESHVEGIYTIDLQVLGNGSADSAFKDLARLLVENK